MNYQFYQFPSPGVVMRVDAPQDVHVALTPFNMESNPMIEVFIGAENNTRSIIRRNRDQDVVNVSTPNILRGGQGNDFRISWANFVILVFRDNEVFPFMGYTMEDIYPVNFYGIRTP
jgi:Farnesoic acid 0-methyl transferase